MNVIASFDVNPQLFTHVSLTEKCGFIHDIVEEFRITFERACKLYYDKEPDLNGVIKVYFDDINGNAWGVPAHMKYEPSESNYLNLEAKILFIDKKWNLVKNLFQSKETTAMRYSKFGQIKLSFYDLKRVRIQIPFK